MAHILFNFVSLLIVILMKPFFILLNSQDFLNLNLRDFINTQSEIQCIQIILK